MNNFFCCILHFSEFVRTFCLHDNFLSLKTTTPQTDLFPLLYTLSFKTVENALRPGNISEIPGIARCKKIIFGPQPN